MTQEEHAKQITDAIQAAENDGLSVEIVNDCCGCSRMSLEIFDDEFMDDPEQRILIMGERK